jgi:hypothetical protein
MKSIYWLASYPKSGNTWVRLFLASYRGESGETIDINSVGGDIATSRELFEEFAGVDGSDLTDREIERYRPRVYRALAARQKDVIFLKTHDACSRNADGDWLFPPEITAGVIYILRNPLDVAVSYAHHLGISLPSAVRNMCKEDFITSPASDSLQPQLPQRLLSWSGHIRSWVDESGLRILVVRYEDLLEDPRAFFRSIVEFSGFAFREDKFSRALEATQFNNLQAQEEEHGFQERHIHATSLFFRQGKAGGWRSQLTPELARKLVEAHRDMMRRFGYLHPDDSPIY